MGLKEDRLEPLEEQLRRAEEFKALCKPDYKVEASALETDLLFDVPSLDDGTPEAFEDLVVLKVCDVPHMFSDWSRLQLLMHLGTRERWFRSVPRDVQAQELQRRTHVLAGRRIRLMNSYEGIGIVRGFVSLDYAEIQDVEVMRALVSLLPEGRCISGLSGISDKASYVYAVAKGAPVGFGDRNVGYPGFVVKNSEVGSCSLQIIPFFYFDTSMYKVPVVLRKYTVLRKVHRGSQAELEAALSDGLDKLKAVWAPLKEKLATLTSKTFASEEQAIERMVDLLVRLKVRRGFTYDCCTCYTAAKHTKHDGGTIFQAILQACSGATFDTRYDQAEIAGALLLHLL